MANIANGVFKQLVYAKESTLGVLQSVAGEGLLSPVTTISLTGAVTSGASITASNITVNGLLIVGQQLTIGTDTYTVNAVTTNAGGVSTAFTLLPAAVRAYTVGTPIKLIQSAEVSNGGSLLTTAATTVTPTAGQTFYPDGAIAAAVINVGTQAAGATVLALGGTGTTGTIAVGQKFKLGSDTTVYTVVASSASAAVTNSITITPALLSSKTATDKFTFLVNETAKYLRRVSSNLDLKKATFKSNEIRTDMQRAILAVGANSVDGTISGELSNRTYADFTASVLRREFTATPTLSTTTTTSIVTPVGTSTLTINGTIPALTNTAGNVKIGDVVTISGLAGANNTIWNGVNFILTGASTTALTLDLLVGTFNQAASAETAVLTLTTKGKKTFVPKSNHVKTSFQIEHFYSDISQSELFTGCRPTQLALKLSPSAMSTIDFTFMGQDMIPASQATPQLATAPQASGNDSVVSANTGALYVKDSVSGALVKVGLVTAFDATVNGNGTVAQVVGSVITPDVFLGAIDVTGNMSIYFTDALYRNSFFNQSDVSIIAVFRSDAANNGHFISIVIPKARLTTATKDDGEKGLILTTPYSALIYDQSVGNSYFEETTIQIQDSAL